MQKTIWLFGDSFTTDIRYPLYLKKLIFKKWPDDGKWPYIIKNYAGASMDMQTIIDFWIKCIPEIKSDDTVIVNLTEPSRIRLSLTENTIYRNPASPKDKNCYFDYINNGTFIGQANSILNIQNILSDDKLTEFVRIIQTEFFNDSYRKNYLEMIQSIYKITPTENKFVWSWHDLFEADFIYDKTKITNEIFAGKWETSHEEWERTNGESGCWNDKHLSSDCDNILATFFYNKFIKKDEIQKSIL